MTTCRLPETPRRADLRPIEYRLLAYLEQQGAQHRRKILRDLASPDSKQGRGIASNLGHGGAPLIVGRWAARLIEARLVAVDYDPSGHYRAHKITMAGHRALRAMPEPEAQG